MQSLLPRVYDVIALVWLSVFHHVLGAKYRFAYFGYDEHFFLHQGWSVFKGQVPYRDFQEFKPPVIFFANAAGIQLFGLDGLGYRKFLALLSLASFLALAVALLRRRVHRLLVVAALMLMIEHFYDDGLHSAVINDAETFALDFFMLGIGVLLTRTKWQTFQQILGGALLALSPLSKEPMAFPVLVAWLTLLLLYRVEAGNKRAALRFALFTISGVVSVLAIWLAYMIATGSLSWFILQMKLSIAYSQNYARQVGWSQPSPPGGPVAEAFRRFGKHYVNAAHLAAFIPFFAGLAVASGTRRLVSLGALAAFAASLYAVSIGGGYAPRYFIMAMAGTFFCVAIGTLALDAYSKRFGSKLAHGVAAACLALAVAMTGPRFDAERKVYGSHQVPPLAPLLQSDVEYVRSHTSPSDKIWTTDNPLLYVFSDRQSAFRGSIVLDEIIEYYPGNTDEERLAVIRKGLEEQRPKLVILGRAMVGPHRKKRYSKALVDPFLRDNGYIRLNDRFFLRPD